MLKQKTLANPVSISGRGLHTGKEVNITFRPAPENHGFVFKRVDLENQPMIHAVIENVTETERGTTIEENGVSISTIEHTLAALFGLSVDNALIEIDSPETPIMDGSSAPFMKVLLAAGIVEQQQPKKFIEIKSNIELIDEKRQAEMIAVPSDRFKITCMIDYNDKLLGTQYATLDSIHNFKDEIAPCRTFVFLRELEYLLKNNLIKGGDFDNAIVFVDKPVTQEELNRLSEIFKKPKVSVQKEGILNNVELNFPNEPARHKLLDIVGDLALLGGELKAHVFAKRPGHVTNVEFAKKIAQLSCVSAQKEKNKSHEEFDLNKTPLYDISAIQKILPHRPPFLLIDKILEMDEKMIIGVKNVTINEGFFIGHFPKEPIMPGVLQIEAMAQCGGILVLNTVPDPENYITYFLKIDNARFKGKVIPGDTLIFKLELMSPIRRGICQMYGRAFVKNKVVMEAEMLAQIVKK
ncbi:MAG: bifunctional UDP-3-O-[3-hydroxymyristoyl] N-acetylglucosamine deacetylase/3-hydroxyacyl-ACP dehydratase [Bacteroidales bacterium]|jgi:UDP-3-O-[3-hydroxymyristoyl] N-acetylglucosamine deacetylase/3-hydroxyacyl-[acyl-carrier-protein] dehydratase|nr:bifunctional UDP-3-O-[3-hydroxymyristoyl] N-acetylglucosamine deacetylase/3-hydroxyacyl-ACP dehydratase [Bacteroidales bacterium]MDD4213575.1 bifunctional UDP-3-O-[3-hydroxymyristoyl] N-acetylglucosamine deacetylase/3-hydroxyacyl-ACP dehydratase [Bacteroidales bacterium]